MNKSIRLIAIVLVVLLALMPNVAAFADALRTKKSSDMTITGIGVDKTTVTAGTEVGVSVTVTGSGVQPSDGMVVWSSPSGRELYTELVYKSETGKLEGTIEIDKYAEAGVWKCVWVLVMDEEGNYAEADQDTILRNADLTIENENPDMKAPELVSIHMSSKQVKPGDEVTVTVNAKDDLSGIGAGFMDWKSTRVDDWVSVALDYNEKKGVLEGLVSIPEEAIEGTWVVDTIDIIDMAGNEFYYSADSTNEDMKKTDVSGGSFTIVGAVAAHQVVPPVIISPTSGNIEKLGITDERPEKPGLQFTVRGLAVPDYKVELFSDGKSIAKVKPDFDGIWKAEVSAYGPLKEIYAVAELPNGVKSQKSNVLTRGQAAKLLAKLSYYDALSEHQGYFKDVPATHPFAGYIEAAQMYGVLDGNAKGLFKPESAISRGEFAKGLYYGIFGAWYDEEQDTSTIADTDEEQVSYSGYFNDVPQSSAWWQFIEVGYDYGLIWGNPNGYFRPDENVSSSLRLVGFRGPHMSDVQYGDWYAGYIYDLSLEGIINGYGGGYFKPKQKVTRAEFAKMVCALKGWSLDETQSAQCSDVTAGHWSYPYIACLRQKGVLEGYACGKFLPDGEITRAEAAKILVAAEGLKLDTTGSKFPDILNHWAKDYILTCVKYKIVSGYPDGTFRPNGSVTRGEAAKMLWTLR